MNKPTKPNRQGLDDYVLATTEGLYMMEIVEDTGMNKTSFVYTPSYHSAYIYKGISSKTAKQLGDEFGLIPIKYKDLVTKHIEALKTLASLKNKVSDSILDCVVSHDGKTIDSFCPRPSKSIDKLYTLGDK